jgi:hypothetical protein
MLLTGQEDGHYKCEFSQETDSEMEMGIESGDGIRKYP